MEICFIDENVHIYKDSNTSGQKIISKVVLCTQIFWVAGLTTVGVSFQKLIS